MPINHLDPLAEKYQIHTSKPVDGNDPKERGDNIEKMARETYQRMNMF